MKIAILGGGHGCYAAAADLSEAGHEVRLWRRDAVALKQVIESGCITIKDSQGRREVKIFLATGNISDAMRGAELVLIPSPAVAQVDIARAMAPYLVSGQVVFLPPGTFGTLVMSRIVRAAGNLAEIAWAETGTLPYLARKHGPAEVNITIRAIHLPTGVYPARLSERAIDVIRQVYPSVHACGDALSGALMNAGPIIHPPLMVMNASALEHFERWDIHTEGTQASVRSVTDQLDLERIAIREALQYGGPHYPLADHYNNDKWMYGDAHKKLQKSGDWSEHIDLHTHRYITEDTELGLALLASLARWAKVDAPISLGIMAIVGAILGRDLRFGERTFEHLGLSQYSIEQLQQILIDGE